MTNFENIEIRDAAAIPRKVAGDYVTQGADDLFHQTARNLNTRLQAATGITLFSDTPTVIALNGMESHVLVDINGDLTDQLRVSLQYFAGGRWYAADWERLQPLRTQSGVRSVVNDYEHNDGFKVSGVDGQTGTDGGDVFLIPTNGAVACRLMLYGSAVSIANTSWARLILAQDPVQHTITKVVQSLETWSGYFEPTAPPYAVGEFIGNKVGIVPSRDSNSDNGKVAHVRSIRIYPNSVLFGDLDLLLVSGDFWSPGADNTVWTGASVSNVVEHFEFRKVPTSDQHKLIQYVAGPPARFYGQITGLDIPIVSPSSSASQQIGFVSLICREAIPTVDFGISIEVDLDWG